MKFKYLKLKLEKKKRKRKRTGHIFVSNFAKNRFLGRRVYFHDSKIKNISTDYKYHNCNIIIFVTMGSVKIYIKKNNKKIVLKKGFSLLIMKKEIFKLAAKNSNFFIICDQMKK